MAADASVRTLMALWLRPLDFAQAFQSEVDLDDWAKNFIRGLGIQRIHKARPTLSKV